jgi:cyclohexadieny/prephenate dehydrogenase
MRMAKPIVDTLAIIGFGLIGSSIARAARKTGAAKRIVACDSSAKARKTIAKLKLADAVLSDPAKAAAGADLVIVCTPLSTYRKLGRALAPALKQGAILSDVGSVKRPAVEDLGAALPVGRHLVPAHPIAGTENSGPEAGFAELFAGRWCIVTPPRGAPKQAAAKVEAFWKRLGSKTARMTPAHHDRVLAITSHVPHLIAYTIVNTASDLEGTLRAEVIKYSASGFRDFTRVAASHPVMWRDVFLANKDAVLEMMGRLYEDIALMQKAIRHDEGETLERLFAKARAIRRSIVQAKQA